MHSESKNIELGSLSNRQDFIVFTTGIIPALAYAILLFGIKLLAFRDTADGEGWLPFFLGVPFFSVCYLIYIPLWAFEVNRELEFRKRGISLLPHLLVAMFFNAAIMIIAAMAVRAVS